MKKVDTKGVDYTERLVRLEKKRWKDVLDVQRPYRWNIKRLDPGKTLEVGCGIGRLLKHLPEGSVGVDHNAHSIKECVANGMTAFQTDSFFKSKLAKKGAFDSILLAHVVEHMTPEENVKLLNSYLPFLKKRGKIIIICPQEKGYKTDQTHVALYDFNDLAQLLKKVDFVVHRKHSFPFPRLAGKIFTYNEFVVTAKALQTIG
jgi:SAM-dependent methyltransferase